MRAGTHTVSDAPIPVINEGPFRININVSSSDDPERIRSVVEYTIHSYMSVLHPPATMAAMPPENDEFGTPYRWLNFPEQYDRNAYENGDFMSSNVQPMTLLAMRMGWGGYATAVNFGDDTQPPFDHVSLHRGKEKVFVFVVTNGQSVTIEDETSMFPSDSLVTRLRMLNESKQPETT